jgi:putative DNA primase/helicase
MSRRAQVIPFERTFLKSEEDTTLFRYIWDNEMPGVLNRALEGIQRLRQRGGQFDLPADCQQAQADFFAHANPLVAFIEAQCIKNPDCRLRLMDMRAAIKEWVMEQGIKRPDCADTTLKRKLTGLGYKVSKIKGYATVHGIGFKPLE